MGELVAGVSTDVPPERLWTVATDWSSQSAWIPLTRTRLVGDGPARTGSRVEAWTGLGRVGFSDVMVIEAWDPPHRLELQHVGRLVRGRAGFLIEPLGSRGSRITWWERVEMPFGALGERCWPVIRPVLRWALQRSLRKLAATASAAAGGRP